MKIGWTTAGKPMQSGIHLSTSTTMSTRDLLLKGALAALLLAAALLVSPRFVTQVYASGSGCSATCTAGSCEGSPESAGETCSCGCNFLTGTPRCTCTKLRDETSG